MLTKFAVIVGAGVVLVAPASAATWRTAMVSSNADRSSFVLIWDINRTTLATVNALRVRSSSSMAMKIEAEVKCKRGDSEASRKLTLTQTSGVRLRPLPVPVRRGSCTVELSVQASDPGRYDLLLQYQ